MARGGSVEKVARRVAKDVMKDHVRTPRPRGHGVGLRGGKGTRARGGN